MTTQELIDLTKKFVAVNSISATQNTKGEYNENIFADVLFAHAKKLKLNPTFIKTEDGRNCVAIFKKGTTKKTIVFIAHHDTVGIEDYETGLNPLDVDDMAKKKKDTTFLHGRGTGDMKSGIVVGLFVLQELLKTELKTNIIFISAPDEENNSAGILAGIAYLNTLKKKQDLEYIGAINLDSVLQDLTIKDSKTIILGGTVGKLLPCFYTVGRAAHVSDPFDGINANLIASKIIEELEANTKYSNKNTITSEITPPPTCLKAMDLKDEYNVQLPLKNFLYFNYLTYNQTPREVLHIMKQVALESLEKALLSNEKEYKKYQKALKKPVELRTWTKTATVYTYDELLKKAKSKNKNVEKTIHKLFVKHRDLDLREKNMRVVEYVANTANIEAPFVVCFFSPPYYPSSFNNTARFIKVVEKTIKEYGQKHAIPFIFKEFSEGISDMNYLQIEKSSLNDVKQYVSNNPIEQHDKVFDPEAIANISMPFADIGPYALSPHQKDEKVDITYTFTQLPHLLLAIIQALQ